MLTFLTYFNVFCRFFYFAHVLFSVDVNAPSALCRNSLKYLTM